MYIWSICMWNRVQVTSVQIKLCREWSCGCAQLLVLLNNNLTNLKHMKGMECRAFVVDWHFAWEEQTRRIWEDGAISEPFQVCSWWGELYVPKMHHVYTVGTWGGEASKGRYFSVRSVQTLQTSQPERERERDLLEIGKSMEMHLTGQKMCAETLHTLSCPSNKHLAL